MDESIEPTKVPRKSCGKMKRKNIPVAAPEVFETVAVIKLKPTLDNEKIRTRINASR